MVAAKLDQSRVLMTKFRENRLMLKGRSAGQRQTDRLTQPNKLADKPVGFYGPIVPAGKFQNLSPPSVLL